eukprot:c25259_g1_i1 orf=29-523(-)
MERPYGCTFAMVVKLSSRIVISELCFAVCVLLIPKESPTQASSKASTSSAMSPVSTTTSPMPSARSAHISINLSEGVVSANTVSRGSIALIWLELQPRKVDPFTTSYNSLTSSDTFATPASASACNILNSCAMAYFHTGRLHHIHCFFYPFPASVSHTHHCKQC